jgi:methylglutaconyl-CoA hydratase
VRDVPDVNDRLVSASTAAGVTTLMLDSPHNRNALSSALVAQLLDGLRAAVADEAVRVIVLSHTGPVFCSGADLTETVERRLADPARVPARDAALGSGALPVSRVGELLTAMWDSPKPVVARLAGPARAGGLGLVAAADLAVCTAETTFAFSEVRLGVIPAVISATVLRRLGSRVAAELYLTGSAFDGARAAEIGLVTAAVPADALDAAVDGYVAALVRGAPGALAGAKELLHRRPEDAFGDEIAALTALSVRYFGSPEGIEGVSAYREKRDPSWVPHARGAGGRGVP